MCTTALAAIDDIVPRAVCCASGIVPTRSNALSTAIAVYLGYVGVGLLGMQKIAIGGKQQFGFESGTSCMYKCLCYV